MDSKLTVPASFVSYLRSGLFQEWGFASEDIANLSIEFGGRASDGAFSEPLHTFFTVLVVLFGEVGWKNSDAQGPVVVNLEIGGAYIVRALKNQHQVLVNQLGEMEEKTREEMRAAAAAKVTEFGDFVHEVETQVKRLSRHQRSAPVHAAAQSTLPAIAERERRPQH
jgi:hypothetical protein